MAGFQDWFLERVPERLRDRVRFLPLVSNEELLSRISEHDIGLAAGNLVLQATALGMQAHQMIGIESDKVRAAYRVPDGHEPLTAIAIGYPAAAQPGTTDPLAQRDLARRSRKSFAEFVISGAWGQAAKI